MWLALDSTSMPRSRFNSLVKLDLAWFKDFQKVRKKERRENTYKHNSTFYIVPGR